LQGAHAVALERTDVTALATTVSAVELPGDDVAVVLCTGVAICRGLKKTPVVLVRLDDRLAELVDLVLTPEALERIDSRVEIGSDLERIVLGIERELARRKRP
jgi:hypothetical protein